VKTGAAVCSESVKISYPPIPSAIESVTYDWFGFIVFRTESVLITGHLILSGLP